MRNPRTHLGQFERLGLERRSGEMQDRAGPVIGIERDPALGCSWMLVCMRMRILVRMMVLRRGPRAMGVVVPVIDVVEERKRVEAETPAECRR